MRIEGLPKLHLQLNYGVVDTLVLNANPTQPPLEAFMSGKRLRCGMDSTTE
jgi:hypothetical protein